MKLVAQEELCLDGHKKSLRECDRKKSWPIYLWYIEGNCQYLALYSTKCQDY